MTFEHIGGQPTAVGILTAALRSGRVANSYLFSGPSGVGKQTCANAMAMAMLCEEAELGCGSCDTCRRISGGKHPDARTFEPRDEGAGNIQVEYLRKEILPVAQYAPFEARRAVMIFPRADVSFPDTHPESANALLKTLEEPRQGVHFVLLSERPDRLLPTIRSRCQVVRFSRLEGSVLDAILGRAGIAPELRGPAIALANGQADQALAVATDPEGQSTMTAIAELDECVSSRGSTALQLASAAESLARSDRVHEVLAMLASFYRDVAAAGLGIPDAELTLSHCAGLVRERASTVSPRHAAQRVELIFRAADTFERNANKQMALDSLLHELRAHG